MTPEEPDSVSDASLSESTVEAVAFDWLASFGWTVAQGPDIAPDTPAAERTDYGLELTYGKALKADSRRGGSVPVYGSNGQVGWPNEKMAEGPGIVVGRKGNPGVVNWISTKFFAIDTTFIVLPKGGTQVLPFLFLCLEAAGPPKSIVADSEVPGLNRHIAYMNRQLIPDAAVVERFDKQVGIFSTRRSQLEGESHVLAAVRDTLLPKLVSGETRLQAAERVVENIQ